MGKKINDLKEVERFSSILTDLNGDVFVEIEAPDQVNYTSTKQGEFYLASVNFEYKIAVRFKKVSGNVEMFKFTKNFSFELSDNIKFLVASQKMRENIKQDFVKDSEWGHLSNVIFDQLDLEKNKTKLEDLTEEIKKWYYERNDDFSKGFSECVETTYFKDIKKLPKINGISFSKDKSFQKIDWTVEYRKNNKSIFKVERLEDFIDQNNPVSEVLDLIYKNDMRNLNNSIGKESIKKFLLKEEEKLEKEFVDNQIKDFYTQNKIFKSKIFDFSITRLGTIDIPKIEIEFENYTHKVPGDVKLVIGYSPTKDLRSKLIDEFTDNIANAIGEFQKVYAIVPSDRSASSIFGKMESDCDILTAWKEEGLVPGYSFSVKYVHPLINLDLNRPNLNDIRLGLIKNSKQNHFDYSILGNINKSFRFGWQNFLFKTFYVIWNADLKIKDDTFNYWFEIDYFKIEINWEIDRNNKPSDTILQILV